MKITKYTKLKNGMYQVLIDSNKYKIHEDLILKYNLLLSKEIDEDKLDNILTENISYQAYNIALKEISRKQKSKFEIINYLKKKEIDMDTINEVVDRLENQGYLNEEFYVDSYIHDKMLLTSCGPLKIKKDLLAIGISSDVIDDKLIIYTSDIERDKIKNIVNKSIKSNKKSSNYFKIKMKNYLIEQGYHIDLIQSILEHISINDSDNYKKEYDKIYKKYSRKYEGSELDFKVKNALYQKGFR